MGGGEVQDARPWLLPMTTWKAGCVDSCTGGLGDTSDALSKGSLLHGTLRASSVKVNARASSPLRLVPLRMRWSARGCRRSCSTFYWRTERAYEELKGELGLDHFEGRSFPGWHHHVTVVLCCYAFIVSERVRRFPPSVRRQAAVDTIPVAA
jgi:hypothetical protein